MAVSVEEALELIYTHTTHHATQILPIESALGYVLEEDIVATHNLPPYDNSAMDGYAVKIADSNQSVKVVHTIFAGDNSDAVLHPQEAIKIMTGARIPHGCECVVPKEETQNDGELIKLPDNLVLAKHIRLCGEDIRDGETILQRGCKLQAHDITLLASQGRSHVKVHKKIKVALFASGNELKMHFENLAPHQLYNTNTPTFLARAEELGCDVTFVGTAQDTLEDIKRHIFNSLDADLIITSGGVSVGDADFTREAFEAFHYENIFDKIEIKPGKPTTFGRIGKSYILNLPGNPLAAALNFELFGQSIILALSGLQAKYLGVIHATMQEEYRLKKGRRTLVPGFYNGESFIACKKFAPGMIRPLSESNCYIMIDESCEVLEAGAKVKVIPTRFSFTCHEKVDLVSK